MTHIRKLKPGKAALLGMVSSIAILTATPAAMAQGANEMEPAKEVQIASGSLGQSLLQVGDAFGVDVIASGQLVSGKNSPELTGTHTLDSAIASVLAGSGLTYAQEADGTIIISEETDALDTTKPTEGSPVQESSSDPEPAIQETVLVRGQSLNQAFSDRLGLSDEELAATLDVISKDDIDLRQFDRFNDILATLPNVVSTNKNPTFIFNRFSVRGFEADNVVNNRPENLFGNPRDDAFVDSIELLRGPASVQVGPTNPGGTVNYVLKTPADDTFLDLEGTVGNYDFYRLEADLNHANLFGSDAIRGRISGALQSGGIPQDGGELDMFGIRPIVEFDLGEKTLVQLSYEYFDNDIRSTNRFPLLTNGEIPQNIDPETQIGPNGVDTAESEGVELVVQHEFLDNLRLTVRGQKQEVFNRLSGGSYVYAYTGYAGPATPYAYGADATNPIAYAYYGGAGDNDQDFTFGDAQLAGEFQMFGEENSFVVGTSYQKFENGGGYAYGSGFAIVDFNDPSTFEFGDGTSATNLTIPQDPVVDVELQSYYAEVALRPTAWLTIPIGIRHDEVENEQGGVIQADASQVTLRGGFSAEVADGVNVYGSFAQSFIPQVGRLQSGGLIDPEEGEAYELGVKYRHPSGMLDVDAAIFQITRDNVFESDRGLGNTGFNAGEQQSEGFEISATARTDAGLTFTAGYGYVDAETTDSDSRPETVGLPLLRVPDHTLTFTGSYEVQSGMLEGLKLGAGGQYLSERIVHATQAGRFTAPSFTIVDAFVSYPITDHLRVQANVLNVFDEEYLQNTGFGSLGGGYTFGTPRSFRVSLRARF